MGCWIALLVVSPIVALVVFFWFGLKGEFAGQCGRF